MRYLLLFKKKQKAVKENDPDQDKIGEMMIYKAIKPDSKLRLASHVGKRTKEETSIFIGKTKEISDGKAPFFCSDGHDYGNPLIEHYSQEMPEEVKRSKRGRPRKYPQRKIDSDLKFAQVIKEYDGKGRLVNIKRTMVFGSAEEALRMLGESECGKVFNTSYVERDNLNSCTHNSRLVRRGITFSKAIEPLRFQSTLDDLYYNFCLAHGSLRRELVPPIPTKGDGSPKRWEERTPAMAEGITDHIWTLLELMFYQVPPIRPP